MRPTVVVALLIAAACGDKPQQAAQGPPPDTAGGRPDLSHPEVGSRLTVIITNREMQTSSDSIQSVATGQVSISVLNQGTATGIFTIDGGAMGRWTSVPLPPGQAVVMSQLMSRGDYDLTWPGKGDALKQKLTIY